MPELPEPEIYTPERLAELLLNCAIDEDGYRDAIQDVLEMGINPLELDRQYLLYNDAPWRRPELYLSDSSVTRQS